MQVKDLSFERDKSANRMLSAWMAIVARDGILYMYCYAIPKSAVTERNSSSLAIDIKVVEKKVVT